MSVTMKELAALAGVSQSTVSLVLNGKTAGRIARDKQEKVLKLAALHKFRPNLAAKGLRLQRQYTVGVIMPIPVNPFYSNMVSLIQAQLASKGYMALFSFWKNYLTQEQVHDEMEEAFRSVFQHNVDGVIALGYHDCLASERIPTVLYDGKIAGGDSVLVDFSLYAKKAVDYLMSLGHRKMAYAGPVAERYRALRVYMDSTGLNIPGEWLFECRGTQEAGLGIIEKFVCLKEKPTAILCQNDQIASGIIFAAAQAGISIPGELSVMGFDNNNSSAFLLPPLTTFEVHCDRIAEKLIELLMSRIEDSELEDRIHIIHPEMIIRKSCTAITTKP